MLYSIPYPHSQRSDQLQSLSHFHDTAPEIGVLTKRVRVKTHVLSDGDSSQYVPQLIRKWSQDKRIEKGVRLPKLYYGTLSSETSS